MKTLSGILPSLDDLAVGARLLTSLPGFLQQPITLDQARAVLRRRLERREADFLELVRRTIYENPSSPYLQLLSAAGCEVGDIDRLVCHEGVEGALQDLYRNGVYLTVDEFKGRRPAIRGSSSIEVDPYHLRNSRAGGHLSTRTSGSRGRGTVVPVDLGFVRDTAVTTFLAMGAGGTTWRKAIWGVPGSVALVHVLEYSSFGAQPVRWFSQVSATAPGLPPRYGWSARVLEWLSACLGMPLPRAEHVPLDQPLPIVRWMAEVLQAGEVPFLHTFASPAVRLCQAALEAGIDLSGACITLGGEPVTPARLATVRRTGARAVPRYSASESGRIGYGCGLPRSPDDVHLFHDLQALIQPGQDGVGPLPAQSLLVSSLRLTAPVIMLNVSMGDQADLGGRECGCLLERLGWTAHLENIRSFEKLTTGGMSFLDGDVIRVLEEVLPARFGGGPTHYQLVEAETDQGEPSVRLLVHPALGPLDESVVADVFLEAIGDGPGAERVMAQQWRLAGLPRVERQKPYATASGKILHLHQEHRPATRRVTVAAGPPRSPVLPGV